MPVKTVEPFRLNPAQAATRWSIRRKLKNGDRRTAAH